MKSIILVALSFLFSGQAQGFSCFASELPDYSTEDGIKKVLKQHDLVTLSEIVSIGEVKNGFAVGLQQCSVKLKPVEQIKGHMEPTHTHFLALIANGEKLPYKVGQKYLLIASYSKKPITIGGGCGPAGLLEQQGYSAVIERIKRVVRGQPIEGKKAD